MWHGGDRLAVEDVPEPRPGPGEVVVDVELAGICGSDLHPYRGETAARVPPLVLGHEAVARVADGSRAAVFPLLACGACGACGRGEPSLCARRVLMGLNRQGVFAERVAVPQDLLVPVPDSLDARDAVLAEPLATAVSVCRREGVGPSSSVLVIGCGSIGLLVVHAAALAGADVTAADPVPERAAEAARLGARRVLPSAADVGPGGADLVIDTVGAQPTWTSGVRAARSGGTVVIVGLAQPAGTMPVGDLVRRGVSVRGHYAYEPGDFAAAIRLLVASPPQLSPVAVLPLARGPEAFERLVTRPGSAVKILLSMDGSNDLGHGSSPVDDRIADPTRRA
jgi:threonine dehydrogenase-like Zn-dependent dehydrogenase